MLFQTTHANAGIALLPDYLCDKALLEGKLVKVLPDEMGAVMDICAISPSRKGMLRALIYYLSKVLIH